MVLDVLFVQFVMSFRLQNYENPRKTTKENEFFYMVVIQTDVTCQSIRVMAGMVHSLLEMRSTGL